jgi:hypothetical protein
MSTLVTVVVCPNCESEMKIIAFTELGNFLECCRCKNRVFVPMDKAHAHTSLYAK